MVGYAFGGASAAFEFQVVLFAVRHIGCIRGNRHLAVTPRLISHLFAKVVRNIGLEVVDEAQARMAEVGVLFESESFEVA